MNKIKNIFLRTWRVWQSPTHLTDSNIKLVKLYSSVAAKKANLQDVSVKIRKKKTPIIITNDDAAEIEIKVSKNSEGASSNNTLHTGGVAASTILLKVDKVKGKAISPSKRVKKTSPKVLASKKITYLKKKKKLTIKQFFLLKSTLFKMMVLSIFAKYFLAAWITYLIILSYFNLFWALDVNFKDLLNNILILSRPEDLEHNLDGLWDYLSQYKQTYMEYMDYFRTRKDDAISYYK